MNNDIVKNHRKVSQTFERFLTYVNDHNGLGKLNLLNGLDELNDRLPELLRNYPYPLHSWPWFISPATKKNLSVCVQCIPALIVRAIQAEFKGRPDEMARFYETSDVLAALFLDGMIDTNYFLQRTDAIWTERGLKILEINAGSSIGGWQIQWLDKQYRKQAALAPFFENTENISCASRNIPHGFIEFLITSAKEKKLQANILYILPPEFMQMGGAEALKLFDHVFKEQQCHGSIHVQPSFEGVRFEVDGVYLRDVKIGILMSIGSDVIRFPQQLYRASFARQLWWIDNPLDNLLGDKRSLAILYRQKDNPIFNAEERAQIEHFIPWGAPVREGMVDFYGNKMDLKTLLLEKKDDFVVKIGQGLCGNDVFIGKYTPVAGWRDIVGKAMQENGWLAQEYCASLPFYGQSNGSPVQVFDVIWGVFGFGRKYGGCWLRLMAKDRNAGVINSAKGAEETIVYEVEV